jgi:uncharacterized membrane protein YfcA
MARSHHRKKHRNQVKQFRHSHDTHAADASARTRATSLFTAIGGLVGGAISYFATQGDVIWILVGLIIGAAAGYMIGKRIDTGKD